MKQKEQDFESALKKLEKIVDELEGDGLSLNNAIKKYEEGMGLSQFCTKKLHDIQKKIEILVKDSSGNVKAKNFDEAADAPSGGKKSSSGSKRKKKAEEFLF